MSRSHQPTRRRFIGTLAGSAAAAAAVTMSAASREREEVIPDREKGYAANDQIQFALIGAGIQGTADTTSALQVPGVKLVAVCDLYDGRLTSAKARWGQDLFTTRDYREIISRPDIDAVIAAVPDHWHKQIAIDTLGQNKSIYLEKPMVQSLGEGEAVIAAQKTSKGILQVGSQGMSSLSNEKARELLAAGAIGKLTYAEGFWARNSPSGAWQYPIPADASEQTLDWDKFLGATAKRPYDPLRFFRWRNYRDYGTGVCGDLFVHLFSTLHFITGSLGPTQIMAQGGLRFWKDGRDVPDVMLGMFDYPETKEHAPFSLSLRVHFVDGTSGSTFLRLVGTGGAMDVGFENEVTVKYQKTWDPLKATQGSFRANPEPADRKDMVPAANIVYRAEQGYKGAHYDHFNNWFTAIRTGGKVVEDAVFGYRAAAPALACNLSYFEKRAIQWDPVAMKLVPGK
ncbi:MAG TPA: Gfo/Idh/MocA family oxidoreductase [Vicinamibacterales bacterium]|nr:Gfo/Idh/MocA family oxidoreductase [Vicinamibacterales bacterium]HPW20271.1 Gfo/Idh/MocA family oxidoreductase [Vicinamibacterales bacterium]